MTLANPLDSQSTATPVATTSPQFERLLTASAQELNSFVCHELRTSVTSVQGVLSLFDRGFLTSDSEEGKYLLDLALRGTKRLMRLAEIIEREDIVSSAILSSEEMNRLQLEHDLCTALENEHFMLFYQPIVALDNDVPRIIGFEALLRWQHPRKGLISPTVFVPIAENNGLIIELGAWVLRQACEQRQQWQQQFPDNDDLVISVNLSVQQLLQADLVPSIQNIITETGVKPTWLRLEITESVLAENSEMAIANLIALHNLGIQLYVDDFGTGYSSLGRLKDFPVEALKIDRSFVQEKRWDICKGIILLANQLNLEVIMEGVETLEDLHTLRTLGCQKGQGYFFARPVDCQQAASLIEFGYALADVSG